MGQAFGCGESRNGDDDSAQAPISIRKCSLTPRATPRGSRLADLEVKLGDGLAIPEEVRLLPGNYFKAGSFEKRPYYRREQGDICIYWSCESWWFSTELNGLTSIAMADSLDDQVPSKGWQTPKSLLTPPKDIPLSVQEVQVPSESAAALVMHTLVEEAESAAEFIGLGEELRVKLRKEMDCCEAGCSAFMQDLIDHSPPALKSCLQPSASSTSGKRLKDISAKDVQATIKETHAVVQGAVQEGVKQARSNSQDLLERSKAGMSETYKKSKAKAAETGELVRRRSEELQAMVQDAHAQYYPLVKEQATTMVTTAKEGVKRKSSEISEVVLANSNDAKVIARANAAELKEKGCRGALDKLATMAENICHAILPHEEDVVPAAKSKPKKLDVVKKLDVAEAECGCRGALDKLATTAEDICHAILPHEEDVLPAAKSKPKKLDAVKRFDVAEVSPTEPQSEGTLSTEAPSQA